MKSMGAAIRNPVRGRRKEHREVHPVDEVPSAGRLGALGLQHVLVMYASTIAVPFIVAAGLGLPNEAIVHLVAADLFLCGVGTLLQSIGVWKVGARMPLVIGASFNLIAPMLVIGNTYGIQVMYGSVLLSGIVVFFCAPVFVKIMRFFPPLVVGTAITLIGINLIPAGLGLIVGQNPESPSYGSLGDIGLAAICIVLVVLLYRLLPSFLSSLAILIALVLGAGVAFLLGRGDVSGILEGPIVSAPELFYFGLPEFNIIATLSMVIVWFVMMIESVGQIVAVGDLVEKPAKGQDVAKALRADGLTSALGGVFQSFGYITFTQNVGVLSLTRVKSRFVTAVAGLILVVLGLFPVLGRVVAAIPEPVLGGVTLAMSATVAVIGIKILARVDYERVGNVVAVAVSLGIGVIPVLAPSFYQNFPKEAQLFLHSGVAAGAVSVFLLNLLFNHLHIGRRRHKDPTESTEATEAGETETAREEADDTTAATT